ncbi:MAG TPA: FdrA family protein [Streptosporangiaceae bacterium]|jgi:FdrA protein|nr:FdrA family protein [Streptosporangiaceae bacterium]
MSAEALTAHRAVRTIKDTYADSMALLVATSVMSDQPGVVWAGAVMATPGALEDLAEQGFGPGDLAGSSASDLVLAVRAANEDQARAALAAGADSIFSASREQRGERARESPRTIEAAREQLPDANVAIISVPGPYAALEAHHALTAGMHVLLFSDNVPLAEEVELKQRAMELGLLVMGPGAGTAVLAGTGLGFANVLRRGPVGVVAAAGTGAQEVSALLDRWGTGVSQVIGVGGRDLSAEVAGRMAAAAVRALDADPDTRAILVVSKPPDPRVARLVLEQCAATPAVAVFMGVAELERPPNVELARTLEAGAIAAARLAGGTPADPARGLAARAAQAAARLPEHRRVVRGFYSGGTLCYEAQLVISGLLGPVYSNEPLVRANTVPAPPGSNVLLDLGAEEYTRGRPHPMIDPQSRIEILREQAREPEVAAVLLDVVLGHGSHPDPAAALAPVLEEIMADGGPQVIAYVLGSSGDPQGYARQRARLEAAGCLVTETAARAAYLAAAIAVRAPELAELRD